MNWTRGRGLTRGKVFCATLCGVILAGFVVWVMPWARIQWLSSRLEGASGSQVARIASEVIAMETDLGKPSLRKCCAFDEVSSVLLTVNQGMGECSSYAPAHRWHRFAEVRETQ